MNANIRLSKTQYCKGKNCLKAIWLYNYKKDLVDEPTEFQAILFKQGTEVGKLAHGFFPGGELIHEDYYHPEEALKHTEQALDAGVEYLFEAAFCWENILIRVDAIKVNKDGTFDLIEVKSTNSVKEQHYDDVAIQKYVLEKLGHKVKGCFLMHLNKNYLRYGDLSIENLFVLQELGPELETANQEVEHTLAMIRATLTHTMEPNEPIGSKCSNPYDCEFTGYCWKDVDPKSIHCLTRISDGKRAQLLELGLEKIVDIPSTFKLSENQLTQVKATKNDEPVIASVPISNHLRSLSYPLHFFDFESVSFAIPPYNNTYSYLHVPFQYSLHMKKDENSELKHVEYLHDQNTDPRRAIAESLCKQIADKGSVIVYYATYERLRLEHLAEQFSDLAPKLQSIIARLWDLETPFGKRWYCDWRFEGKSSIKNVLPIMVSDLSYDDLDIRTGTTAAIRYEEMIKKGPNHEKAKSALLEYCKRDTIAMVRVLEELLKVCPVKIQ